MLRAARWPVLPLLAALLSHSAPELLPGPPFLRVVLQLLQVLSCFRYLFLSYSATTALGNTASSVCSIASE